MKTVAGLMKVQGGSIDFGGTRLNGLPAHRIVELGISMVPEGEKGIPQMTVWRTWRWGFCACGAPGEGKNTQRIYDVFPILRERSNRGRAPQRRGTTDVSYRQALMSLPKSLLIDEMSLAWSLVVQELSRVIQEITGQGT